MLTALRGGADDGALPCFCLCGICSPVCSTDAKDGRSVQRKKRRIDGGSASPRTSPSLTPAPAPSPAPRAALKATSAVVDATPNKARGAATPGGRSSGTSYMDPAKARREVLQGQLPLTPGRKVAFRQPSKAKTTTGGTAVSSSGPTQAPAPDEEGETWIMAIVKECINNDRNRCVSEARVTRAACSPALPLSYVVVDAEDVDGPWVACASRSRLGR